MADKEIIETLVLIMEKMEEGVKNFDRRPFDRDAVAEGLGGLGAAISALALIIISRIEKGDPNAKLA